MSPAEIFVRRPVMTLLLVVSALLFGILCYRQLPVNDLPAVDYPVIQVTVSYPGASPDTVAANIATPLEQKFMEIPGLEIITSSSSQGVCSLVLQFGLSKSIDAAATDVQAAITRASGSLPSDLPSPPVFTKTNPNDAPIFYIALASSTLTEGQLYDFAKSQVAQRFSILKGVSQVSVYGSPRAVRIAVRPQDLTARGITLQEVAQAVRSGTSMAGVGQLDGPHASYVLAPHIQLETAEQYGELIVAYRNGAPVRLRDVADCREGQQTKKMRKTFWVRGYEGHVPESVVLAINRSAGANAVAVSQRIRDLLPSIKATLPDSMDLLPIYDRAKTIIASVNDVKETLLIAFGLVIVVIFVFLGRAGDTIIPTVAMPMSMVLTFIGMRFMGYSLDNLSLMALTLAVGFLVDDAIVFLENTVRLMQGGMKPMAAAIRSVREISFTIFTMTVSLAAVFIPLVFMAGIIGRVFQEFAVTIIIAILSSGIVSLTLTPLMCARMLSEHEAGGLSWMERTTNAVMKRVLAFYDRTLTVALRHPWVSLGIWVLCLGGTGVLLWRLPKTFLPVGDSGFVRGIFIAAEESSPDQMIAYQERIDRVMQANPALEMGISLVNLGQFLPSSQGLVLGILKDRKYRPPIAQVSDQLARDLFAIPGVFPAIRPNPVLSISTGATAQNQGKYAFAISGTDRNKVYDGASKLLDEIRKIPGVTLASSDLHLNTPRLAVELKRDPASTYGVTAGAVEGALRNAYSQNYTYLIKEPLQQYQVIVEVDDAFSRRPEDLALLWLNSSSGSLVPIEAVAEWRPTLGPQSVNHINQFDATTIFFDLSPHASIGEVTAKITKLADQILDPTLIRAFMGEAQTFSEAVRSLMVMGVVAIFVMYVLLGILYESYVHPLTVLSGLFVATLGGLLTLWIFRSELSLYADVGLFLLMGIVKKNGIMIVDFALHRMNEGLDRVAATKEACMERLRPILMTTFAALMGAVPIALGYGSDGESRRPLGLCIVGGLVVSQVITLYLTPVIFLELETFQEKVLDRIPLFRRSSLHDEAEKTAPAILPAK
ncbi:MAG: efflux RND transporter permease subunit [Verrucomicrobiae bacterium]|nr:efflux RND transporter permease subunit [Verrucomicrobiae bacterium]